MFNQIKIVGDHATILINKRSGAMMECAVDTSDISRLIAFNHKWCCFWSETARTWYVYCRNDEREMTLLHRFLLNAPAHLHVDHKDHNGLNNRRRNIRCVTR